MESGSDLRNAVGLLRADSQAIVEFYREGKLRKVSVKIKPIEEFSRSNGDVVKRLHGARFRAIAPSADHPGGILVGQIAPNSEASASGLKEGDIIIGINRKKVFDLKTMKSIIAQSNGVLLVQLLRDNRALYLVIQ